MQDSTELLGPINNTKVEFFSCIIEFTWNWNTIEGLQGVVGGVKCGLVAMIA